jgi:hypothetical protein
MSPKVNVISDYFERLYRRKNERIERRKQFEKLLPEDFSGQIFLKAREEGERIRQRLTWLEGERARVVAELRAAQLEVRNACTHVWIPGKMKGDILGEFSIEDPVLDPHRLQLGPKALALRQKRVNPLLQRKKLIEREIYARQQELGELRKMANRAGAGDISWSIFYPYMACKVGNRQRTARKLPPAARMLGTRILVTPGGEVYRRRQLTSMINGHPGGGWYNIEPDLPKLNQ